MEHRTGAKRELYDLEADPSESKDVIAQHTDISRRLSMKLSSIVRNGRSSPGVVQKNDTPPWGDLTWMD